MATQAWLLLQNLLHFVHKGFFSEFVDTTMFKVANCFWVFVFSSLVTLYRLITKLLFRDLADGSEQKGDFDNSIVNSSEKLELVDGLDRKQKFEFSFLKETKDYCRSNSEAESSVYMKRAASTATAATSSRYQFVSGKNVSGFMEETQTECFAIQEMFVASNGGFVRNDRGSARKSLLTKEEIMGFGEEHDDSSSDADGDESFKSAVSMTDDHLGIAYGTEDFDQGKTGDSVIHSGFSSVTLGLDQQNAEESPADLGYALETERVGQGKAEGSAIHLGFTSETEVVNQDKAENFALCQGFTQKIDQEKMEGFASFWGFISETEGVDKEKTEDSAIHLGFTLETEVVNHEKAEAFAFCQGFTQKIDKEKMDGVASFWGFISETEGVNQEETEDYSIYPGFSLKTEGFDKEKVEDCVINSCGEEILEKRKIYNDDRVLSSDLLIDSHKIGFGTTKVVLDEHNGQIPTFDKISNGNGYGSIGISDSKTFISKDQEDDTSDEYTDLVFHLQNTTACDEENFPGKGGGRADDLDGVETSCCKGTAPMGSCEKSEDQSSDSLYNSDSDDEDDLLWGDGDLIEQMRMEAKNARIGGLPTILEEFETPKVVDDLKPLIIDDEKIGHKDRMAEILKFYKSYAEKMRKLDILNYQTMQAISLLQRKEPIQLSSGQKSSTSTIKSFLVQNFRPGRLGRIYADQTLKSISELRRDLELVYVGQLCLSWEILCWQHRIARELQECDPRGIYSYNQVAGDFQHFQVLVQRFVEDEQFQGPRVLNYANKRSLHRTFFQVPVIKSDSWKDKKGRIDEETVPISIAMLAVMIKEAMHDFWEFLRADKHEANVISKHRLKSQINLLGPENSTVLINLRATMQMKEKRLKDVIKSGNCIVNKFQKQRGGRLDHVLFLSQVELRLLSRVLNLSKITADQLEWCQKKINNINLVDRRIHIESSFLLFPC